MTTHGTPRDTLWATLARKTDPETSKQAAREIAPALGELHKQVVDALRGNGGVTATELSQRMGVGDPRRFNRRLPELVRSGVVVKGQERACRVTGRNAATYWLTEEVRDGTE